MYINLHPDLREDRDAVNAATLASACVHCGFCLATCPTYLDNRDERDSPRGRIYLVKELLETGSGAAAARDHLDRCLTCRSCETTCPSGVQYAAIADAGKAISERRAPRPLITRLARFLLRQGISRPGLFRLGLGFTRLLRPLLPAEMAAAIPVKQRIAALPRRPFTRKMLLLEGCVQDAATPATNAAARQVFADLGIELISAARAGCCGAVDHHLGAHEAALVAMRRNIDAWWPAIEAGAEAVLSSATGCAVQLADYGRLLAHDSTYGERAQHISALTRDVAQVLVGEDLSQLQVSATRERIAVHTPCTQVHGLHGELVSGILCKLGYSLTAVSDNHLCCGSAGTYSLLQPATSQRLRAKKITALCADDPDRIVTANVGCQLHLAAAAEPRVTHWLELVAGDLQRAVEPAQRPADDVTASTE